MASSLKPSTIAAITAGTVVTGLLAYAVYFDHKRRNDPEFRKQLKRESKRTQRAAKEQEEAQGQEQKKAINEAVARANEEGFPKDSDEVEAYFMQEVAAGEGMVQKGMCIGYWGWDGSANDLQAQITSRQLCASTAH
jgi:import receptor subunit TOM20